MNADVNECPHKDKEQLGWIKMATNKISFYILGVKCFYNNKSLLRFTGSSWDIWHGWH